MLENNGQDMVCVVVRWFGHDPRLDRLIRRLILYSVGAATLAKCLYTTGSAAFLDLDRRG